MHMRHVTNSEMDQKLYHRVLIHVELGQNDHRKDPGLHSNVLLSSTVQYLSSNNRLFSFYSISFDGEFFLKREASLKTTNHLLSL